MGRGTVLRHPAVTPVLTLTLSLSLTCTRAPLALTQPCGSAEETPLWQRKRRGSDSGCGGAPHRVPRRDRAPWSSALTQHAPFTPMASD